MSPIAAWPEATVDEDELVRRVMDGVFGRVARAVDKSILATGWPDG